MWCIAVTIPVLKLLHALLDLLAISSSLLRCFTQFLETSCLLSLLSLRVIHSSLDGIARLSRTSRRVVPVGALQLLHSLLHLLAVTPRLGSRLLQCQDVLLLLGAPGFPFGFQAIGRILSRRLVTHASARY